MSAQQNYNQDINIFNGELISTNFPLQTTNKETKSFRIDVGSGQSVDFAHLIVSVNLPSSFWENLGREPNCTIFFNGNSVAHFVWGNGEPEIQTTEIDILQMIKTDVDNDLEIDVDGDYLTAGFKVSADVVYELNTPQGPTNSPGGSVSNVNNSNNPFGLPTLPTWKQIEPYVIVGAVGLAALIFVPKVLEAIVTSPTRKCNAAIC